MLIELCGGVKWWSYVDVLDDYVLSLMINIA